MRRVVLLNLALTFTLLGQRGTGTFEDGLALYNTGAYWEALRVFSELSTQSFDLNPRLTASRYMKARCLFRLRDYQGALWEARLFQRDFPQSSYQDDIHFLLGQIYGEQGAYAQAAWEFAQAATTSESRKVRNRARQLAAEYVHGLVPSERLPELVLKDVSPAGQLVTLLVAERYLMEHQQARAFNLLFQLRPLLQSPDLIDAAIDLDRRLLENGLDTLRVGVILPLSGTYGEVGNTLLNGLRLAAMQFMDTTELAVELLVRDNAALLANTIDIAREFKVRQDVSVIIGPLVSSNVRAAAAVLYDSNKLLFTPTATEDELTRAAVEIYQFQPNRRLLAQALAEYAVKILGLKTFAVISPSDDFGRQCADAFARRVDFLGGHLLYQGWYAGQPTDLSTHFRKLRMLEFERLFEQMSTDTINPPEYYQQLLKPILKDDKPSYSDSLKVPLGNIDAFFFPLHQGDVPFIASQFAHYNFRAYLLGIGGWSEEKALRRHYRYLPHLAIAAGEKLVLPDTSTDSTVKNYYNFFGVLPDRYAFLGYDVMSMLLQNAPYLSNGTNTWRQVLQTMPEYRGLTHRVYWGGANGRENASVFLLEFFRKKLIPAAIYDPTGFHEVRVFRAP